MKAKYWLDNPKKVEASLTITMPIEDWCRLQDQLNNNIYPAWRLSEEISGMIRKANQYFCADAPLESESSLKLKPSLHRCEHCDKGLDGVVAVACAALEEEGKHPGTLKAVKCPHCEKMSRV